MTMADHLSNQTSVRGQPTRNWITALTIALIVTLTWPGYLLYKDWKAEQLVKEARQFLSSPNYGKIPDILAAVMNGIEAIQLSPENINAIRLNAELLTQMSRNEAIFYWEKLEAKGQSTPADHRGHIRSLLRLRRFKEAQQKLDEFIPENSADPEDLKFRKELTQ